MRIYTVENTETNGMMFVCAKTKAQAIAFAARNTIVAREATQEDLSNHLDEVPVHVARDTSEK